MINSTNLLTQKLNILQQQSLPKEKPEINNPAITSPNSGLISKYLQNVAMINAAAVSKVKSEINTPPVNFKNDLRTLFANNQAKILAIIPRTFNAKDTNGNEYIDGNEQHGTFLNAIDRLDELKNDGFNTIHLLPIHPPGKEKAMSTAGSLYSPKNMLEIDPRLIDPNDPRSDKEQFKAFTDECHKRGIKVMMDLPSCASYDMFLERPELMAIERDGLAKTPQGWNDIRMFQPWEDEGKEILNPALLKLHKDFIDWCIDLGVDGIRADVARAKPLKFWQIIIPYSRMKDPEFGWLAETYTYEDASPQANMPYDRPEDSLRAGFDTFYGQYHIFHEWSNASEFIEYVEKMLTMSKDMPGKSLIGSFATHDDMSPMFHGGTEYCNLTMGLQATLPMLNPYIVDGYQTGDWYKYGYGKQNINDLMKKDNTLITSDTGEEEMFVHYGKLDIFNLSRKPGGNNPEIGDFMRSAFKLKDNYANIINKGSFIELSKIDDKNDQIIAYARHLDGKTLLVVANQSLNRSVACKVKVPTLKASQDLTNLLPSYGQESILQASDNELRVDLGPGRIHVFEINTPNIKQYSNKVYRQNL